MQQESSSSSRIMETMCGFLRKCLFRALSVGPIPSYVAFIMDGNRRYAKRRNLVEGDGHRAGFSSLMTILGYCYDLGIRYVTVYAFSIDNFKRRPNEVQCPMDLMVEKIEELLKTGSVLDRYGIRMHFIGNLKLLNENVQIAAEKAMKATASNNKTVLLICVAYTSCDEIVHTVQRSCEEKLDEANVFEGNVEIKEMNGQLDELGVPISPCSCGVKRVKGAETKNGIFKHVGQGSHQERSDAIEKMHKSDTYASSNCRCHLGLVPSAPLADFVASLVVALGHLQNKYPIINLVDIEKNMYMAVAPDPDIVIRSSGETRLSNFLLWQTAYCPLYAPDALWPDMGLWHLVWAVLSFQRSYSYLQKKKKQL
ncbi:dehydrodolichyl diphosphate synthase 6-like [Syzygium oleosum]|uniref:dehydrodolichyl diphosphate synthase 6-like n=1 Tax=Syzygium oleosum TaxID=219896 RepID=UPI0024BB9608|nr:dehydrodolichyl diphosphate synthase 6-like [Syzygium oleosum]